MKIYQGVDIVDIAKFKDVLDRSGDFVRNTFTRKETLYCLSFRNAHVHFAGRFASKEACLKALGRGFVWFGIDRIFQEIEVVPGVSGKPSLSLSGRARSIGQSRGVTQATVSISHTSDYCVATVILLADPETSNREDRP